MLIFRLVETMEPRHQVLLGSLRGAPFHNLPRRCLQGTLAVNQLVRSVISVNLGGGAVWHRVCTLADQTVNCLTPDVVVDG